MRRRGKKQKQKAAALVANQWVEVFASKEDRWVTVDVLSGAVDCPDDVRMTYTHTSHALHSPPCATVSSGSQPARVQ